MVTYEWVVEEHDQYGDIIDPLFFETYKEAIRESLDCVGYYEIALVRNTGNDEDGLTDRQYAYVNDDELPEEFDLGNRVPARFHSEVRKEHK